MKIVAVVPMKLNNQRLPGKNIKCFTNGKALCSYILNTLLQVKQINDVYVYCSDADIQNYIPEEVRYLKRDSRFDGDDISMSEILKNFANDVPADVYVMTHATSPFITARSIEKGITKVLEGYDSAFAVELLQDFLWDEKKPINYELTDIPRTQDLPKLYKETSGFYIYKSEVINQMGRRIGKKSFMVEVGGIEAIDIDEPEDFLIADAVFQLLNR